MNDGQIWALVLTIVLLFLFFGALYVSGYKENREKRSENSINPHLRPLTRSDPGHHSARVGSLPEQDLNACYQCAAGADDVLMEVYRILNYLD